jgi:glucose-6-phosphate 1-dehydrogenase
MPRVTTSKPQTISYPAPDARPYRQEEVAVDPHVVVLFGATGDLARRKLIPGLAYLDQSELAPHIEIVATSLEDISTAEFLELAKVFRSMLPVDPKNVVRGQFAGYRELDGVARDSDTETFIALKVGIDNWRWAGVPVYLRTGKRMAEGMRIISIAFKEAPRTMFAPGSGVGSQGPDHLTFDLADNSKVSLSFYGKRPGPGMKLDKLSMQFSTQEVDTVTDVLEAYERLVLDAMRGDHTLFTTAEGIESLWERSADLLADPPPAKPYPQGTWGPNAIHQLIAPNAWRLPFERAWREAKNNHH